MFFIKRSTDLEFIPNFGSFEVIFSSNLAKYNLLDGWP